MSWHTINTSTHEGRQQLNRVIAEHLQLPSGQDLPDYANDLNRAVTLTQRDDRSPTGRCYPLILMGSSDARASFSGTIIIPGNDVDLSFSATHRIPAVAVCIAFLKYDEGLRNVLD